MSWTWILQNPHPSASNAHPLHILVGTDLVTGEQTYLAFITVVLDSLGYHEYRAMVPRVKVQPRGKMTKPADYHYTHDSLQEAKDYCVAELVNRRLT